MTPAHFFKGFGAPPAPVGVFPGTGKPAAAAAARALLFGPLSPDESLDELPLLLDPEEESLEELPLLDELSEDDELELLLDDEELDELLEELSLELEEESDELLPELESLDPLELDPDEPLEELSLDPLDEPELPDEDGGKGAGFSGALDMTDTLSTLRPERTRRTA